MYLLSRMLTQFFMFLMYREQEQEQDQEMNLTQLHK